MKQNTSVSDGAEPDCKVAAGGPGSRQEEAKAASGSVSAFQEKMERWTDRVGYGAYRGLICGLFTAWGLAAVLVVFRGVQAVLTHSFGKHDTATLGEFLVNMFLLVLGYSVFFPPVGVIVGAFLGAAGIIRKKKRPPEPPKTENAETTQPDGDNDKPGGGSTR